VVPWTPACNQGCRKRYLPARCGRHSNGQLQQRSGDSKRWSRSWGCISAELMTTGRHIQGQQKALGVTGPAACKACEHFCGSPIRDPCPQDLAWLRQLQPGTAPRTYLGAGSRAQTLALFIQGHPYGILMPESAQHGRSPLRDPWPVADDLPRCPDVQRCTGRALYTAVQTRLQVTHAGSSAQTLALGTAALAPSLHQ
jgi:hypothetical protein